MQNAKSKILRCDRIYLVSNFELQKDWSMKKFSCKHTHTCVRVCARACTCVVCVHARVWCALACMVGGVCARVW